MTDAFSIDFQWLDRNTADEAERLTFAEIKITVGGVVITEVEDVNAKTIRPGVRLSAYAMAIWLLDNWWRLLREPERATHSWEMSHCLGAIGQGFLWPDLSVVSDGRSILLRMTPTPKASQQMVRYLNGVCDIVSVDDFETTVLTFVDAVINRLQTMGCQATQLLNLREAIEEERNNLSSLRWREIEALLGYDPDEAPEKLIKELIAEGDSLGSGAVDEVLALSKAESPQMLNLLFNSIRQYTATMHVPDSERLRKQTANIDHAMQPWERAAKAAQAARKHWAIQDGPVSNQQLLNLFTLPSTVFTDKQKVPSPITVGFLNGNNDRIDAYLNTPYETNRRFALMRIVGDRLSSSEIDRFLPVTTVKTARQKFQRAFAQEFLCPSDELKAFIGEDFGEDKLDDAAHHFNVSTRLIETTMVNKWHKERDILYE